MPAYEPDPKPLHPHPQQHTPKDQPPTQPVKPDNKPQADKTAGDLRKEDAEVDTDQLQAEKQGIQDVADDRAMQDYKSEQLEQFPPDSDPLKDREARRAEDKKQHHHGDKPSTQKD